MKKVNIAGGIILNNESEILLVHNELTNSWTYPKGHIKGDEDILEAAKREIIEETNIKDLKLVCKLPIYERTTRQNKNIIKVMHMFLFISKSNKTKTNTKDITNIKWVPVEKVVDYFSYSKEVDFFNSIKNKLNFQSDN